MPREGQSFEDRIARDLGVNRTCNSGAKWGDGDLHHPSLYLEAKDLGTKSFSLPHTDFVKMRAQMARHGKQVWAYLIRNGDGEAVVLMPYDHFVDLYGSPIGYECPHCGEDIEVEL